jgi:hypothetical protein
MLMSTLVLAFIASAPAQQYDLSWYTIDGGGTLQTSGGAFTLSGTIGQPDAGRLSGGHFELTGGFWFSVEPGDCNDDGVLGLPDFAAFGDCLTGPAAAASSTCRCFDVNADGRVDLADFAAMTGR